MDHSGAGLLGRLADQVGLRAALSERIAWQGERALLHDRGRLLCQAAVMLADGGECLSDLSVPRNEASLWGDVASEATAWRAFHEIDDSTLAGLETALAGVRERVWDRLATGDGAVVIDVGAPPTRSTPSPTRPLAPNQPTNPENCRGVTATPPTAFS